MNKAAAIQFAASIGTAAQGIAGTAVQAAAYLGATGDAPRGGLQKFIQEIRDCASKEAEQARIDRELANIRAKFCGTGGLTSYKKKKYVWKLVYIFMLGYEIEFGHLEMISLISSPKYSEKAVGYIAVSLLMRSGDDMMNLVVNSMRNDLQSHSNPAQTLALATIANLGGVDLRDGLFDDVKKLLLRSDGDPCVRKKAALCLLRFFRESTNSKTVLSHSEWANSMSALLEDKHLGVVMSCMALLNGFATSSPSEYEVLVPYVILLLTRLTVHKTCRRSYFYYETAAPWLQVKLLQFLQLYPASVDSGQHKLGEVLTKILNRTELSESVNKTNADHAILFEAINLIIQQGDVGDMTLRTQAMSLLGRFIAVKEPNIRFLGLETMSRLARLEGNENIKIHQKTVMASLKDADISMRRRALDLLFVMSDPQNAMGIVEELMTYLDTSDPEIKEEMVLKIAILAEKFTSDLRWYVDTVLQMISVAGDHVSQEVWHRIVQIVTNNKDLQSYAAERLFNVLRSKRVHETAVNVGGYLLGEFGFFIAEQEGMSGDAQFEVLHQHFSDSSTSTRALLLSSYAKLANLYPQCASLVLPVFIKYSTSSNLELQQRACEYLALSNIDPEVMEEVLKEMPPFPENKESGPEARLRESLEAATQGALGGSIRRTSVHQSSSDDESDDKPKVAMPIPVANDLLDVDDVDDYSQDIQSRPSSNLISQTSSISTNYTNSSVSELFSRSAERFLPEMNEQIIQWFRALTLQSQGVLFENEILRVGVIHEYRSSQGRVLVYYYNLTSDPILEFSVEIPDHPFMRMQIDAVPSVLEPGGQAKQQVMCEAMQPFIEPVELRISFCHFQQKHYYPLRLPVVVTSFMEPAPLTAFNFEQRWQMLTSEQREQYEIVNASSPVSAQYMASLAEKIAGGLKMGLVIECKVGDLVITAAGAFKTGTVGQNGVKIAVGAMLKIEGNPLADSVSITIRAVHGKVSIALKSIVKLHV